MQNDPMTFEFRMSPRSKKSVEYDHLPPENEPRRTQVQRIKELGAALLTEVEELRPNEMGATAVHRAVEATTKIEEAVMWAVKCAMTMTHEQRMLKKLGPRAN